MILVTRQLLFSAVRQTVARRFLPTTTKLKLPDEHLLRICHTAADQNTQLFYRLLEIVTSTSSRLGMIDYHNAFNAGIILELARLQRRDNFSVNDTLQFNFVLNTLQSAGQRGDEFAQDCSIVLADFRQLAQKLIQAISNSNQAASPVGQTHDSETLENALIAYHEQGSSTTMYSTPGELSFPMQFEGIFDEFMTWLDDGIL